MAHPKKSFLFLFLIHLIKPSSEQCADAEKQKWCIDDDYVANNKIVDKSRCKNIPCIVSTCPYGEIKLKTNCTSVGKFQVPMAEFLTVYTLKAGVPIKSDKIFNTTFQMVTYKNRRIVKNNNCTKPFLPIEKSQGFFLEDGSFFLKPNNIFRAGEYIVKYAVDKNGVLQLSLKFAENVPNEDNPFDALMDLVINSVSVVSCLCMILVLTVYVLCKELRTTAGLIFMTYVCALVLTFLMLLLRTAIHQNGSTTGCYIISILHHYLLLSSFTWMNIMGFDIWWTLRNMYYQRRLGNPRDVNYRKYTWYCLVAYLPSLVYVIIEICVDEFSDTNGPRFRACTTCSNIWYVAGPPLILQMLNFIPLILIIYNLLRIQNSNMQHFNSDSTGPKQNALLCIKISITLGTNWFLDIILLIFNEDLPYWFTYTVKIFNASFGMILFLAYILKSDVMLKVFKRLSINNKITEKLERRVARHYSSKSRKASQQSNSNSATVMHVVNSQPEHLLSHEE